MVFFVTLYEWMEIMGHTCSSTIGIQKHAWIHTHFLLWCWLVRSLSILRKKNFTLDKALDVSCNRWKMKRELTVIVVLQTVHFDYEIISFRILFTVINNLETKNMLFLLALLFRIMQVIKHLSSYIISGDYRERMYKYM